MGLQEQVMVGGGGALVRHPGEISDILRKELSEVLWKTFSEILQEDSFKDISGDILECSSRGTLGEIPNDILRIIHRSTLGIDISP